MEKKKKEEEEKNVFSYVRVLALYVGGNYLNSTPASRASTLVLSYDLPFQVIFTPHL